MIQQKAMQAHPELQKQEQDVQALMSALNVSNRSGATALMAAAEAGHADAVELLLDAGADPDIRRDGGLTALMFAAASGSLRAVTSLLDAGADPAARDASGRSALEHAGSDEAALAELLRERTR